MVITSISLFVYGIGTVTSLAMTYIEGARRDKDWDFYRVTGIILCFFWPVLVPLLILAAVFSSFTSQKRHVNGISLRREKTLSRKTDINCRNEPAFRPFSPAPYRA